jgi:hypothetical protein
VTYVTVEIPFGLDEDELVLDPAAMGDGLSSAPTELRWLAQFAVEEELPRILAATVLLFDANAGTIGQCLHTAIVWERG